MNTFIKTVFLMLAVSAKAEKIWEASDSTDLNADAFEEDPAQVGGLNFLSEEHPNQRPGSNYCTYSPDYDCYRRGWPSCCQVNDGRDCPRERPQCDTRRPPNPRPTPTSRPTPSPTRRTRRPSRRPTRRPTPNPTRRPTNRRPTNTCVDDDRPRPVRGGQRFRFNLVDADAQCVDLRDRTYEWGQFNDCDNFSECAEMCVNNVPQSLASDSGFRGYDYDCEQQVCRCLYDSGTLDNRNSARFNRVNRNEPGRGSISGTTRVKYSYCGKLVGAEFLDDAVAEA